MVVNGKAWPTLEVDANRYRMRILNGSDSRVLILKLVTDKLARPGVSALPFWQIGADGGYLPKPVKQTELLLGPAERADVIIDFSAVPKGTRLYLINEGPDEPFSGGRPDEDFDSADPATTGQVMELVVSARRGEDDFTRPLVSLKLPVRKSLGKADRVRTVSLNEAESETVLVVEQPDGSIIFQPNNPDAVPFAPVKALLGTASVDRGVIIPTPREWMDEITENPQLGSTEIWEIYNFTADAHPIHLHQVQFEVVNRQPISIGEDGTATLSGKAIRPEASETGTKDTVLAYPEMVTRVKAKFDLLGLYVWHCHILSHEDNEMMRPMCVGPLENCKQ